MDVPWTTSSATKAPAREMWDHYWPTLMHKCCVKKKDTLFCNLISIHMKFIMILARLKQVLSRPIESGESEMETIMNLAPNTYYQINVRNLQFNLHTSHCCILVNSSTLLTFHIHWVQSLSGLSHYWCRGRGTKYNINNDTSCTS